MNGIASEKKMINGEAYTYVYVALELGNHANNAGNNSRVLLIQSLIDWIPTIAFMVGWAQLLWK